MLWRCFVLGFYECMRVCAWCLELLVPFFVIVYTCVGRGKGHLCAMMFAACSGKELLVHICCESVYACVGRGKGYLYAMMFAACSRKEWCLMLYIWLHLLYSLHSSFFLIFILFYFLFSIKTAGYWLASGVCS